MSSLQVFRANGVDRARDLFRIDLHAKDDTVNDEVELYCAALRAASRRGLFDVHLYIGQDFKMYSADGVEVVISIWDHIYMQGPTIHTQRWVIEKPPGGHIAGKHEFESIRVWDQQGGHIDYPPRWPPGLHPTYDQALHEARARESELAPECCVSVSVRLIKKLKKDYNATPEPIGALPQNTDPPKYVYDEWMKQDPKLLRQALRVNTRSDDIRGLGGKNKGSYRFSVAILKGLADRPNTSLASTTGGLPFLLQPSQRAGASGDEPRSSRSIYGNQRPGPSDGEHATWSMAEAPSFLQTAPNAQMPSMTPHMSRSFTPNMRQNQQPDPNQFGMPGITLDEIHRRELSRPAVRRSRNSLTTGPMGSHRGRNGDGNRSGFRPRQPVAPGNEASQTPSASRPAMPQPHEPNDLIRDLQGTTLPETIELLSSSDDDDDQELEERRKRRRFN
ncbi:hypothetical protein KC354_g2834 [Hortaea werneckii]|nr:hypothetical protein KC354_g2834 [Hortaea werneckii]